MIIKKKTKQRIEYFLKHEFGVSMMISIVFLGVMGLEINSRTDVVGYVVYSVAIVCPMLLFALHKWRSMKGRKNEKRNSR